MQMHGTLHMLIFRSETWWRNTIPANTLSMSFVSWDTTETPHQHNRAHPGLEHVMAPVDVIYRFSLT